MDRAKKWTFRIGSILLTVIGVTWALLNAGNSDVPEQDLDNDPTPTWPQIVHGWLFSIEHFLALVGLVVIVCFVYGWWHDRKR
jgi:hypothetical protein